MAQTALEAFPLGYSQAPDCGPSGLVDRFHPHVGQRSALRAGTKPRLSGTPSVDPIPARRQSQDQLVVRSMGMAERAGLEPDTAGVRAA